MMMMMMMTRMVCNDETSESKNVDDDDAESTTTTKKFDPTQSKPTPFLCNIPFNATRHDVFELFRKFGRIEAAYLKKERETGVFRGTAFVRFETERRHALQRLVHRALEVVILMTMLNL
jgi:nucleolar protein 4